MFIQEINTKLSSHEIFLRLKDEKHLMFLDSRRDPETIGRYSLFVINPRKIIQSKEDQITIDLETSVGDPLDAFQKQLDMYQKDYQSDLPFIGGWVGFLSYDLKQFIEKLPVTVKDDIEMPDLYFGLYDGGLVIDHLDQKVFFTDACIDDPQERLSHMLHLLDQEVHSQWINHSQSADIQSNFIQSDYLNAINKIRDYIKSGDIYQANMTQRFQSPLREPAFQLYEKLRTINPAPFASYIDFGTGYVASSSPERFIKITDGVIETRPIKGTMPRSEDPIVDLKNKEILKNSKKDQSELLMIVDLERNDLSRIAKTGSVQVTELFKIESYATVHHLVSTVRAEIDPSKKLVDVLRATFPGGSITGAPKIRAMEIIDELEPTARGLYTGSIGYIDLNGNVDLNIVIRTFIIKDDRVYFQAGGGIVWDSNAESEYQESLDKAYALMNTLNYGVSNA